MADFFIYTAGGMENVDWDLQTEYRNKIKNSLEDIHASHTYRVKVWNPPNYFNFQNPSHDNEREVMEFDLNKVRKSDLIIVNFTYKPVSLGTMAEMAIAYDRQIPIIGLCENEDIKLHAWQKEMCLRIFSDINKLIEYVKHYYIN